MSSVVDESSGLVVDSVPTSPTVPVSGSAGADIGSSAVLVPVSLSANDGMRAFEGLSEESVEVGALDSVGSAGVTVVVGTSVGLDSVSFLLDSEIASCSVEGE